MPSSFQQKHEKGKGKGIVLAVAAVLGLVGLAIATAILATSYSRTRGKLQRLHQQVAAETKARQAPVPPDISIRESIRALRKSAFPHTLDASVTVVTYADNAMAGSMAALLRELQPYYDAGLIQAIRTFQPKDLMKDEAYPSKEYLVDYIKDAARRKALRRGGGYWLWKPYIIQRVLEATQGGADIVVWIDAGCMMQPLAMGGVAWLNAIDLALQQDITPVTIPPQFTLRNWTKASVMRMFNVDINSPVATKPQFAGGHMWIRNTPLARRIVQRWSDIAANTPEAFMDLQPDEPRSDQYDGFIEHRHDQSTWALLLHQQLPPNFKAILNTDFEGDHFRTSYLTFARRRLRK